MRTKIFSAAAAASMLLTSTTAFAAPPRADLQMQLIAPSSVEISTATTYTATVKNLGPATTNATVVIDFPLTNTSPTVHILGTVTESELACSIASNKMTCTVSNLKKNKTATFSYSYTAPVSTKSLEMKATATSSVTDPNALNNSASVVPNLVYPSRPIVAATVTNSHCTGTNLTSYFECLLFPSSISTHETTLNADNTISFTEPGYSGTWAQNVAKTSLTFSYFEVAGTGSTKVAEFNGFAIIGLNCFDGLTTFFPEPSAYVSPYRVCLP